MATESATAVFHINYVSVLFSFPDMTRLIGMSSLVHF